MERGITRSRANEPLAEHARAGGHVREPEQDSARGPRGRDMQDCAGLSFTHAGEIQHRHTIVVDGGALGIDSRSVLVCKPRLGRPSVAFESQGYNSDGCNFREAAETKEFLIAGAGNHQNC